MRLFNSYIRALIVLPFLALSLLSCEREIEVPFPDHEPRLVVNSLAYSNQLLRVFVSRSFGMNEELNEADLYLTDATVELWRDGSLVENLTYFAYNSDRDFGYYSSDTIQAGSSYRLVVSHPDYPQTSLDMTMGRSPKILNATYVADAGPGPDGYPIVQLILELDDAPDQENFYALRGTILAVPADSTLNITGNSAAWEPLGTGSENINRLGYYILPDAAFAGKRVELVFENTFASQFEYDRETYPLQYLSYELLVVNRPAYQMGNEYGLHRYSQRFIDLDLSVLTRSALPYYSNAEGGLGFFGGITSVMDTLHL